VRFVSLEGRERAVTLTERGHHLLEAHRRDRAEERVQAFSAGVSRPRELSHDAQLYGAYLREEERLRDQGGEIQRVVLEQELKREYQEWLQERNRGRADSDGRPDRDEREIEEWAREHELPYFDESVHFPDFRIEHELEGRDAVRDAFLMPLTPREVEELEWYFRARQGEVGPPPDPDLDLPTAGRKFAAARYEALYREWQQRGIQALWAMRIDTLRDALQRGRGRIEFAPLSRQYLQLTPLIGTPAEIENCLEPGDNLGFV
jgi:hypothetical protein